jgi:hypothetical protein
MRSEFVALLQSANLLRLITRGCATLATGYLLAAPPARKDLRFQKMKQHFRKRFITIYRLTV